MTSSSFSTVALAPSTVALAPVSCEVTKMEYECVMTGDALETIGVDSSSSSASSSKQILN